jgi:subtilisin-like proprotein convertase family protein
MRHRTSPFFVTTLLRYHKIFLLGFLLPFSLWAETLTVTDSTTQAINDNSCISTTLNVSNSVTINNMSVQMDITHTYRGDLTVSIQSPAGTQVTLTRQNGGNSDNLNVVFDDSASRSITSDSTTHTSTVMRIPQNALSAFQGEDAQGIWTLTICDGYSQDQGSYNSSALIIDYVLNNPRPFSLKKLYNIKGDMTMIGNSIMLAPDGNMGTNNGSCASSTQNNSDVNMVFADMDNDTNTFNSTSSHIELPTGVAGDDILFAGLYWQGRFIRQNIPANARNVLVKLPGDNYSTITATDDYNVILNSAGGNWGYNDYQGVADITQRLKTNIDANDEPYSGDIWIADIKASTQQNSFGAWMLIVVYKDDNAHLKNISIYDGFVSSSGTQDIVQVLSGFKTPKSTPVNAKFFVFGGEGDIRWDNDTLSLTKKDGTAETVAANVFDSSIRKNGANVLDRSPSCANTIGIDIDSFSVGIPNGDAQIIGTDQRATTVTIATPDPNTAGKTWDQVFPGMFAFSADLYIPSLCYDYTVQLDDFDITEDNETIRAIGQGKLSINVAIKSEEGDFDLKYSNLKIKLLPDNNSSQAQFDDALYSPNTVNTLMPAIYSDGVTGPSIAIGEDADTSGGTIKRNQRYFSQFNHQATSNQYLGRFQIDLNTTVDFGSGPVPVYKSSASNNFNRCGQEKVYNPLYGSFNVERHSSTGAPNQKYPLYTQVLGKDFDFDVVAYTNPPQFDQELTLDEYTVDLELINIRPYTDKNATFSCANTSPSIIQTLTATGDKQMFVKFNNSSRVNMSSKNIQTDRALRNAAFRIWYLVDENNTIIKHTCADANKNSCFENIYNNHLKSGDTFGFCTNCSSYSNPTMGTSGCYACLRDHFARSVCSRDNFAIRPASYTLSIYDTNESSNPTATNLIIDNATPQPNQAITTLAAGYRYRIDGNATSYIDDQTLAKGYTVAFDGYHALDRSSNLRFNDKPTCYDQNGTFWELYFRNGKIYNLYDNGNLNFNSGNLISHSNVGHYAYSIIDKDWTLVDQARYTYKTFPGIDDCILDSAQISINSITKSGCEIRSVLSYSDSHGSPVNHTDLNLTFQPYSFDLGDINITSSGNGNYLFLTNFDIDPCKKYTPANPSYKHMSTVFEGNISAKSKTGAVTTNFTNTCAASDVTLRISRVTMPAEANLSQNSQVSLQQHLDYGDSHLVSDTANTSDANLTLIKAAFEDAGKGKANIQLYAAYSKPVKTEINATAPVPINPITVSYKKLLAHDDNAASKAHMTDYTPKGSNSYDHNKTYLYTRVAPQYRYYENVTESNKTTPLYIEVYCDNNASGFGLNTPTPTESGSNWRLVKNLFASPQLGNTDLNTSVLHGLNVNQNVELKNSTMTVPVNISKAKLIHDVPFETDGTQTHVIVSIQDGDDRPATVKVNYCSSPWLVYDVIHDFYRVQFIGKGAWGGVGTTGNVVNTGSSSDTKPRMSW